MTETAVSQKQDPGLGDQIATFLSNAIDKTDEAAALDRVSALQDSHPEATADELVEKLIRSKCLRTGGMGALTPVTALIGIPINLGLVFKWQAELVLEIAAVYNRALSDDEKRKIVLLVTGISVGTTQLTRIISRWVERTVAQHVAKSKTAKAATPLVGSIISASANFLMTYLIGNRAAAYFRQAPERMTAEEKYET